MSTIPVTPETDKKRETFFKLVFGNSEGYICIAHREETRMTENFFLYPQELPNMLDHINRIYFDYNTYFCPQLLSQKRRKKEYVSVTPNLWSDLDTCAPNNLRVKPSIVVESSAGRYQGYWILDKPIPPVDAEDLSRRIAYAHVDEGADNSGWDLTQLLECLLHII